MPEADPKATYAGVTIMSESAHLDEDAEKVVEMKPLEGLSDEEFKELVSSVLVVIPHRAGEGINPGIATHFGMWGRIGLGLCFVKDPHGGFIEVTRGGIVQLFLEYTKKHPKTKYLVMIDNDQSITWDAPLRLALHGKPVVSGIVCGYSSERGIFACIMAEDENGVARFPSLTETKTIPASGLREIRKCGTGLVCIRRDVLETIKDSGDEPFFIPEEYRKQSVGQGQLVQSEDVVFCDRARQHGFKIYVDFGVHAAHYKTVPLHWPDEATDSTMDAIEWSVSPFDYKGVD